MRIVNGSAIDRRACGEIGEHCDERGEIHGGSMHEHDAP